VQKIFEAIMGDSNDLSPKAKVSYDQDKFQVEFNVQEYAPEELSIKTEGDVLIVLAKHETKAEGGPSFVSKQFEQRFSLPSGVKPEKITSSLSKEGVLTVTAPRERASVTSSLNKKPIENNSGQVFSQSSETKQESDGLPHPKVSYDDDQFQIALNTSDYRPEDLDVKVEGNTIIITAKQEVEESGGTRTRVFEQKFSLPSGVKPELVKSTLSRDGTLTVTAPRGNVAAQSSATHSIENRMDKVMSPPNWDKTEPKPGSYSQKYQPSSFPDRKEEPRLKHQTQGSLFAEPDKFFDDSSVFERDRSKSLFNHDERSLFAANSEETGVSKVQYDDKNYNILVNVENFKPEELVIKTIDNTVHVEAKHEEKTSDGRSYSTRSFSQSFTLPRGVNPESVTSALSKQGVLTISAPLPQSLQNQNAERLVPIKF